MPDQPFHQRREVLALDFHGSLRPQLVTELLRHYRVDANGDRLEAELIWEWPVSQRILELLRIVMQDGADDLTVKLTCDGCDHLMGLSFTWEEFSVRQTKAEELQLQGFVLRRPTGRDQLTWQRQALRHPQQAREAVVKTLMLESGKEVDDEEMSRERLVEIEQALQDFDPLVNFVVAICCPACKAEANYALDLQEIALKQLQDRQTRLMRDVHSLAQHYHWTEAQILDLPPWRRAQYLSFIEQEFR